MALRPVRLYPDPILRQATRSVDEITDKIRSLLDDMLETMYAAPGVGLAAPQVGVDLRVMVMNVDYDADKKVNGTAYQMINPKIIAASEETYEYEEGCLSLPGISATVKRPQRVTVEYLNRDGKKQTLEASGLLAVCVQHEIDHLDGILFVDHLSRLKRDSQLRRYKKLLQNPPAAGHAF